LTQKNDLSTLASLHLDSFVGIFQEMLHRRTAEQGVPPPCEVADESFLESYGPFRLPGCVPDRSAEAHGTGEFKTIPRSARYEHDKKRESTGGNPPSGHKKPELPCPALFTPRCNQPPKPSGAASNTENQPWNCAFN
jgi:hypothetical protein